jgi:hypothetical protein
MSPHEIKKHHRDTFGEYIALSGDDTQDKHIVLGGGK